MSDLSLYYGGATGKIPGRSRTPYCEMDTLKPLRMTLQQSRVNAAGIAQIKVLVRQGKLTAENANVALDAGMPPLHLAISRGHINVAELLLDLMCSDNTIDINCRDASGMTPLHHALQGCHVSLSRTLLEKGADCNAKDASGRSSVMLAVLASARAALGEVIDAAGADLDLDATDMNGQSPLFVAITQQEEDIVALLVSSGASVQAVDADGLPALHYATCVAHNPLLIRFLQRNKARVCECEECSASQREVDREAKEREAASVAQREDATRRRNAAADDLLRQLTDFLAPLDLGHLAAPLAEKRVRVDKLERMGEGALKKLGCLSSDDIRAIRKALYKAEVDTKAEEAAHQQALERQQLKMIMGGLALAALVLIAVLIYQLRG